MTPIAFETADSARAHDDDDVLDTDVAVVGAGPVGLTLANLLADHGLHTLLLERAADVGDEPRAISITDESLRVMAQLGNVDALLPEMLVNTGARYFGRKGQLLAEVRAQKPRLGQPVKSQFDQPVLVRLLRDAACGRPLIDLRFKTEASELVQGPDDSVDGIEFRAIGPRGSQRVRAKWLVACDGGRSPIRSALGIPLEGSTQLEKWIVVDVLNAEGPPDPDSEFHCNGRRPCVVVPGVNGRCRYEFMLLPGDDPERVIEPAAIVALIAPYAHVVPDDIRRAAVYVSQQRVAVSYRQGRVLLAGDAAHLMPPFAGQGLNAGVRDAANLAWKLAAHVRGDATEVLVDTYQTERRPHAVDMVRLSLRIGKVVMSTRPLTTALRDHTIAALGLFPAAKAWVDGMKFLKQPHFASGCVLPEAPGCPPAAAAMVGRALAQPSMLMAGGEVLSLDRLLGGGWALLSFPDRKTVEIRRESTMPASASIDAALDRDDAFAALHGSGTTLIVRPDRYVAAAVPAGQFGPALDQLSRWVPALPARFASADARRQLPRNSTLAAG